jgi:ABC-type lipoprotein export system ATPase subunit
MTVLHAETLARRLGDRDVVAEASLDVAAGESIAVLGPSGCGKTTFLQMIGLLDRPSRGRVVLDGVDGWTLSDRERAELRLRTIGFVFQLHHLVDRLDVRENVALPAWRLGGSRAAAFTRADALLDRLGLSARRTARPRELSVGEAQRAAIARALINEPRIVLADEPTGALDSASARAAMDALDLVCERGAALVVVTHAPEVADRARRRVRMLDGRLVDQA